MSVDDMLWWLYDTYKIVVGTRTIRRVFERKGHPVKPGKGNAPGRRKSGAEEDEVGGAEGADQTSNAQLSVVADPSITQHQSPYALSSDAQSANFQIENQLRQAMEQQETPQHPYPALANLEAEEHEDEETIQLELEQIALQKREVELKLKMRRLNGGKGTPASSRKTASSTEQTTPSTLFNPSASVGPTGPKRDSRSKKKIEESKRRTAERQERMLRDLERRSRRREHLTAEWVQSKDIWPLRAQGMLADLMHQYNCYAYSPSEEGTFDQMYRDLYQLVDHEKGDWDRNVHDEMLRERMKRKMGQLRAKMHKTGEIVGSTDGYGGLHKAENYTGEQAGATLGDESEIVQDPALVNTEHTMQTQPGAPELVSSHHDAHMHYDPLPDHQQQMQQHADMSYPAPIMHHHHSQHHEGPAQYPNPMLDHNLMPYAQMGAQELAHQGDGMVM